MLIRPEDGDLMNGIGNLGRSQLRWSVLARRSYSKMTIWKQGGNINTEDPEKLEIQKVLSKSFQPPVLWEINI